MVTRCSTAISVESSNAIKKNYAAAATTLRVLKFVASLLFLMATLTWTLQMDNYISGVLVPLLVGVPMVLLGLVLSVLICFTALPTLCWPLYTYREVCIATAGYWTSWLYMFRFDSRLRQILAVTLGAAVLTLIGIGYLIPWYLLPNTFKIGGYTSHPMIWFGVTAIGLLALLMISIPFCFSIQWSTVKYIPGFCAYPAIFCSIPFFIAFTVRLGIGNEITKGYFLWTYVFILAILPLLLLAVTIYTQTLCLDWEANKYNIVPIFYSKKCCRWSIPSVIIGILVVTFIVMFCVTFDVTYWDAGKQSRVRYIPVVAGFTPLLLIQLLMVAFYFCKMMKLIPENSNKFPCTLWLPPTMSSEMVEYVV